MEPTRVQRQRGNISCPYCTTPRVITQRVDRPKLFVCLNCENEFDTEDIKQLIRDWTSLLRAIAEENRDTD